MTAKGRDTEARVLARAVQLHTEGRISILISHRFATVRQADRIAVQAVGTAAEWRKLIEQANVKAGFELVLHYNDATRQEEAAGRG